MTTIDKTMLQAIEKDIDAALADVATKHGVSIKCAGGKYGYQFGEVKLAISTVDKSGQVITKEARAFHALAASYGLPQDALGMHFTVRGKTHKIIGLKARARRRPVLTECEGREYVWPADAVLKAIGG